MNVCVIGSYEKALVMTADRIPLAGETLRGFDYRGTYGGKGSDMAVQAARLGAEVSYIGVVGNDDFGREFIELMKKEGVDISGLRLTDQAATGVGFIVKDKSGRNVIVVDPGANDLINSGDIDRNEKLIRKADVVLAQLELPISTALYALKKAKGYGKTTILNPAPAVFLLGEDLRFVDILTPNETEARVAAGFELDDPVSDQETAEKLLETGCGKVVMTLGDKGSAIIDSQGERRIQTRKVHVVDSNGAGDCFNASLAVSLADGKSLEEGVEFANACSAFCCTRWETVPSYGTQEEVETFIQGQRETVQGG